jgi:arylsulfatase A-like enzyme
VQVYAGLLWYTDRRLGPLIDALADLGVLQDTPIYATIGDNRASTEGTSNGCFNVTTLFNGAAGPETVEFMASHINDFGIPKSIHQNG